MKRRKSLAQRREELVARSNQQRAIMTAQAHIFHDSLTVGNLGASLLSTIRENKLLIAAGVLAAAVFKPRRIISVLKAGVLGWQAWRNVVPVLQSLFKRT